ncbi:MAG: SufD family Fe-S cluster assembly protein [Campylobacterales bacterium]|nr:SufD family Fe-S cluster assembly protein [Campylobacterales bacterium]
MKNLIKNDFTFIDIIKDNQEIIIENKDNNTIILLNKIICKNFSLKIIIKKNLNINIIDLFLEENLNNKREFVVNESSKLDYYKIQNLDENKSSDIFYKNTIKRNAFLNMYVFEFSSLTSVNEVSTILDYQNSSFSMNILVNIKNKSFVENIIHTIHQNENTKSNIKIKHILKDKSKSSFKPLSIVQNKAINAQAYQYSKAILCNDGANVLVEPHLEILVDELKAAHGSSIGFLDKNALYYLQSRGISLIQAKELLLKAFENEIYDSISNKNIKEFIKNFKRSRYV